MTLFRPSSPVTRREFIKIGSAALGSLVLSLGAAGMGASPVQAEWADKLYHGTMDGKILVSEDGGSTWQQICDLGSDNRIARIQVIASDQLQVRIMHRSGYPFYLRSKDGKVWFHTA